MKKFLLVSALLIAGCSSTSHIRIGDTYPEIDDWESVKIYREAPEAFEEIAILESSSDNSFSFTHQGKMDAVIKRLKKEAAELGANGVLIGDPESRTKSNYQMHGGTGATYNSDDKYLQAIAIRTP